MPENLIELQNVSAKAAGNNVLTDISFTIRRGEQWAIVGPSGSGKTSLALSLLGRLFYSGTIRYYTDATIGYVEQQHRFRTLSNTTDFYYQQRFQSQDAEDSLTIRQELHAFLVSDEHQTMALLQRLHLGEMLDEPLIQLSNGENKRLQIARALLNKPGILILDNPFTGLDTDGRRLLHDIINKISADGMQILLITSLEEMPACITHLAVLDNGSIEYAGAITGYEIHSASNETIKKTIPAELALSSSHAFDTAIKMVNVNIRYGDKLILDNINWTVNKGERWSVSGANGAGKSTLLSLITADNPQAYANEIYLFDRRRGRGESIWDIKKNIGFVSPEMHLYFPFTSTCFEVIASGLFDTTGLFRAVSEEDEERVNQWLELFDLQRFGSTPLQQLSLGRQRMSLLARALVKNPPLLVLDEPCQGLDDSQVRYFNQLIDQLCTRFNTTLLYVSHYQQQLPACINHWLVLENGRVNKMK
jgi:molybdate transport system ATP-binding protein